MPSQQVNSDCKFRDECVVDDDYQIVLQSVTNYIKARLTDQKYIKTGDTKWPISLKKSAGSF